MSEEMKTAEGADPAVKVPAAVKAAADRANAIHKAVFNPDPPADGGEGDGQADPHAETEAAKPAQAPPTVTSEGNNGKPIDYEHAYKSMKGRFDAREAAMRQMSEQITHLQGVIATMNTPPREPTPPELQPSKLITPEEEQEFGPEFLDVVGRRAKEELGGEVAVLRKQIDALQSQLNNERAVRAMSARDKLHADLDRELPNWRAQNKDDKFLEWLGLPDPYSGAIRHTLLKAAYDQNDSRRVLAIFRGFLSEEAATAPAPGQPPLPTKGKASLDQFAAPGRARTAAAPAPAEKPIITRAQISQFYADVKSGKYRGRDAERDAFERQIFEAQADGRIQ